MALVKKTKIVSDIAQAAATAESSRKVAPRRPKARNRAVSVGDQTISERVAAATEELASGLTEASAATTELARSMEQIAAGAEEAAGASHEQSSALKRVAEDLGSARTEATASGKRADAVLAMLLDTGSVITASIRAIELNAERHLASVKTITELEDRAKEIENITHAVSRISDQTNLLALNAAIEAARAGEQGRAFAVVADEVRTLAETSEKSAQDVQQLSASITTGVTTVVDALKQAAQTAANEAVAAADVVKALELARGGLKRVADDSRDILNATIDAERAAVEAAKGGEQIAAAAEEQSAGASEAQSAVRQQATSLAQAQLAAQALAVLADQLRVGKAGASAAEQIGSSAEELSAVIQELSSAAAQVMAAIEQINRSCQLQASATQQTSAALAEIENSAKLAQQNGKAADDRVRTMKDELRRSRAAIERLVSGVKDTLQGAHATLKHVAALATVGRRIDKIVNVIAQITLQTSMLAVSGAVEAARSGDAGRGFAVVSNDIRALAREASDNVERAKDTVRDVAEQVAVLQRELDQIIASAEIEIQTNRSVLASLQRIDADVDALGIASNAIVERSHAVLQAAVEAATGSRQVATAAEEASVASREAATAAAEQSQGAEDLAAAIEEIGLLADELARQSA